MKRATQALFVALLTIFINASLTMPARADCAEDIKAVRGQLAALKDEPRRQELQKLVEKAAKDEKAGRIALCDQTVQRAYMLLK